MPALCRISAALLLFPIVFASVTLRADIFFDEEIWEEVLDAEPPLEEGNPCAGVTSVCTTDDGRGYLFFDGESPFLLYNVNVSSLPADKTRFSLELELRTVRACGTVWGVTNLNNDSFVGIDVGCGDSAAGDDRRRTDSSLPGVNRTELPTTSTEAPDDGGVPTSILRTRFSTLELELGDNLLKIDGLGPQGQRDGDHPQVFQLIIGPGEPELRGEVTRGCLVRRTVVPQGYIPGEPLMVALSLNDLPAGTTVTEELPSGLTVLDAGGGLIEDGRLRFTPRSGDSQLVYVLGTEGFCETSIPFSGVFAANACSGELVGDGSTGCAGGGGVLLTGEDWQDPLESAPPLDDVDPCFGGSLSVCDTDDGQTYVSLVGEGPSIVYPLEVARLPADRNRFPIQIRGRMFLACGGVLGVRNLTTDSFVAMSVGCNRSSAVDDLGARDNSLGGLERTEQLAASTLPFEEGGVALSWVSTESATLALAEGENLIQLEDLGASGTGDADHPQLFALWVGSGELQLQGPGAAPLDFSRGDATADGRLDVSDGVFVLNHLFLGGSVPRCLGSADMDDSGVLDVTDGSFLFNHLFLGGPPLPAPFPACGADPTPDGLTCFAPFCPPQ